MSAGSDRYVPQEIEQPWQDRWAADGLYNSDIDAKAGQKLYCLTMLPYPSGDLHIGHWYAMTPPDARARFKRMQGYNVLYPIGFDSFGLPAENAAIKRNVHPREWTYANIEKMRGQLRTMGAMWDWRREIVSSDPTYYRWSQWFFLQLWKNDLAYRKLSAVDFCPHCNTTLAREQVWGEDRHCERCDTPVIKKNLDQWFFRTTEFADALLDFDAIDWPERVKTLQTNWIGRSEGAHVRFTTEAEGEIEIFTTRPDTLWGATFMVLAPEHPLVAELTTDEQRPAVDAYVAEAIRQTDIQRESTDTEKTGVFTGGYAINPVNNEKIPVWVANYVLMGYGTGAIMAVPAHDDRDFAFARKYGIEVRPVIDSPEVRAGELEAATTTRGPMINSGTLTGTPADDALSTAITHVEELGVGAGAVNYRLRDWLISRQRYWGTPIPAIHCTVCGIVAVPEAELPVVLPDDIEWRPTGESPLKFHDSWKNVACPQCGGDAERDTDTMDTFMCSSWYPFAYLQLNGQAETPWEADQFDYWTPVDSYTGGIEHAAMHLIYVRFFTKALQQLGIVPFSEPMVQLRNQGIILGEDSEKMSKSRGNVAAPDDLVERYGADTVRAYLMFFARWEQGGPWSSTGIEGVHRWLHRLWSTSTAVPEGSAPSEVDRALNRKVHQTIQSVTRDLENFQFNTVISSLMELTNALAQAHRDGQSDCAAFREGVDIAILLSAPVAPHITEELWSRRGGKGSVHVQSWPQADPEAAAVDEITLVVQVNGKVRDKLQAAVDIDQAGALALALASESVQRHLNGEPKKIIYIPGRLINLLG